MCSQFIDVMSACTLVLLTLLKHKLMLPTSQRWAAECMSCHGVMILDESGGCTPSGPKHHCLSPLMWFMRVEWIIHPQTWFIVSSLDGVPRRYSCTRLLSSPESWWTAGVAGCHITVLARTQNQIQPAAGSKTATPPPRNILVVYLVFDLSVDERQWSKQSWMAGWIIPFKRLSVN